MKIDLNWLKKTFRDINKVAFSSSKDKLVQAAIIDELFVININILIAKAAESQKAVINTLLEDARKQGMTSVSITWLQDYLSLESIERPKEQYKDKQEVLSM